MTKRVRSMIIVGIALLGCSSAQAQDAPRAALGRGLFGAVISDGESEFRYTELNPRPANLVFVELSEQSAIDETRDLKASAFGPFPAPVRYSHVSIYQLRGAPAEPDSVLESSATVAVVASTRDRSGRVRWWSLQDTTQRPPDRFDITDDPSSIEEIALAVSDAMPLLRTRWESMWMSGNGNSGGAHEVQLLLDFRTEPPSVVAQFKGVTGEGGGRCGLDNIYTDYNSHSCEWNPQTQDFVCTDHFWRKDTIWLTRRAIKRYWMTSGAPATAAVPLPVLARRLWEVGDRQLDVVNVGSVRRVAQGSLPNGVSYKLFAAPGIGSGLDARWLAVLRDTTASVPRLVEFGRVSRIDAAGQPSQPITFDVLTPAFAATHDAVITASLIDQQADAAAFRVTVREGKATSIYAVTISAPAGSRAQLDTLLLASTAEQYGECQKSRLPETAVGINVTRSPLTFELDVEPERRKEVDEAYRFGTILEPDLESRCGWRGVAGWTAAAGFTLTKTTEQCSPGARELIVASDGAVSSRPVFRRLEHDDQSSAVDVMAMGRGETAILFLPDPDFRGNIWEPVMSRLQDSYVVITANLGPGRHRRHRRRRDAGRCGGSIPQTETCLRRRALARRGLRARMGGRTSRIGGRRAASSSQVQVPDSLGPRLHALTGDSRDRVAFLRDVAPSGGDAEKIAAFMRDTSIPAGYLTLVAALNDVRLPGDRSTAPPVWLTGREWIIPPPVREPDSFGMVQDPDAFTIFLLDLLKKSVR